MTPNVRLLEFDTGDRHRSDYYYWGSCCGSQLIPTVQLHERNIPGKGLIGVQLSIGTEAYPMPESSDMMVADRVVCGDAVITVGSRIKV